MRGVSCTSMRLERTFDSKVMLKLWVKVKSGWSDDIRALKTLGLDPQGDQ